MANRDVIVIGASAGGVEALRTLVARLPRDLPATILVVLHIAPSVRSALAEILQRTGPLPAIQAVDGAPLQKGTIVVAPPDQHLMLHDGRARLTRGPRENGHRPAVDPLFRSAARWHGPHVIAVVLSGSLDDGTFGARAVRSSGGVVVVQSPEDALHASMPLSVIDAGGADHVATNDELPRLLDRLTREPLPPRTRPTEESSAMRDRALEDEDAGEDPEIAPAGLASAFTCPECHGALWELRDGDLVRYRCRVGHAYASESLMANHASHVDEALWTAYRALEEAAALAARLSARAHADGMKEIARLYEQRRVDALSRAKTIRAVLEAPALASEAPVTSDTAGRTS